MSLASTLRRLRGAALPRANLLLLGASALALACGCGETAQAAPKLKVLFSFTNVRGVDPYARLIADGAGNLYGTTLDGGANNEGAIFELSPPAEGKTSWTETVLFSLNGAGGKYPYADLIADGAGNLYGTTYYGGKTNDGVVFELSPPVAGQTAWTQTVLLSFDGAHGKYPRAGLIADGAGNLYGTTFNGGANNQGCVFELTPPTQGKTAWTETVLLTFNRSNGWLPEADLIADSAGNLYGTTDLGGASDAGVVFELSPPTPGKTAWSETVLQSFDVTNGNELLGGLLFDSAGNLYGTAYAGGANNDGVVFELSPPKPGKKDWTDTVLQSFDVTNGNGPEAGLIADSAGNLIGTTIGGGPHNEGVVFKLSPPKAGKKTWTETVLQSFDGVNGNAPGAGLIADAAGNLYGTTIGGGMNSDGIVFKLKP